jgi:cytochrome c oxidase subunit 2
MKRWNIPGRFALLMAVMATLLTGCGGVFDPQGPVAKDQYWLIQLSFIIMIVVLIIVFAVFFYVLVRFRKRKGQTGYPEQVEGNHKLEIIWTVSPFILVMVLAAFTVSFTFKHDQKADPEKAIDIKVIGHQFWWEFYYEDYDIRTAQDFVIPADTPINVKLESADVIHSFWIPQLAGKMDTNPGMTNEMTFGSGPAGATYLGKCAELCGASHALMDFKAVTLTQEEFDAWVTKMKAPAPAPTSEVTKAGEAVFANKCIQCHAVTTDTPGAGPNLAGFANRETVAGYRENTKEWLDEWLRDPQKLKPGTMMPQVGLSDQEVGDLVEYLHSLK